MKTSRALVIIRRIFFLPPLLTVCLVGLLADLCRRERLANQCERMASEIFVVQENANSIDIAVDALGIALCAGVLVFIYLML